VTKNEKIREAAQRVVRNVERYDVEGGTDLWRGIVEDAADLKALTALPEDEPSPRWPLAMLEQTRTLMLRDATSRAMLPDEHLRLSGWLTLLDEEIRRLRRAPAPSAPTTDPACDCPCHTASAEDRQADYCPCCQPVFSAPPADEGTDE